MAQNYQNISTTTRTQLSNYFTVAISTKQILTKQISIYYLPKLF